MLLIDNFVFRFDTEVQKVNTVLLQEKQVLNKTQKERDEIISERFTLEQELKVLNFFPAPTLTVFLTIFNFVESAFNDESNVHCRMSN